MPLYRATGTLVIRPCATCMALVLHEERDSRFGGEDGEALRPFPHNAPGGAVCIGGAPGARRAAPEVPRPATAARFRRARQGKRQ